MPQEINNNYLPPNNFRKMITTFSASILETEITTIHFSAKSQVVCFLPPGGTRSPSINIKTIENKSGPK